MSKIAFLFPGQGAQKAGMGQDFYEKYPSARQVFDQASQWLSLDMKALCFEKNDRLNLTEYTQAALVTTCLAMEKVVEECGLYPDITAGLSLGEYCAIAVSGGMSVKDAIVTVRKRGILMEHAVAASFGVFWNKPFVAEALGMDSEKFRPNGLMLSYPVITSGEKAHKGSFESVLREDYADEEKRRFLSLEYNVTKDTPSTFLWHTAPDDTVPVENSLLFFQALHALDIPAELHIYPVGSHGLGLATAETACPNGYGIQAECESWIQLAGDWMKHLFEAKEVVKAPWE